MLTLPSQAPERASNPHAPAAESRLLQVNLKHSKQPSSRAGAPDPGSTAAVPDRGAAAHVPIPRLSLAIPEVAGNEQQAHRVSASTATGQGVLDARRQQGLAPPAQAAQSGPVHPHESRPPPAPAPAPRGPVSSGRAAGASTGPQPQVPQVRHRARYSQLRTVCNCVGC
jgi:hypothetical protein